MRIKTGPSALVYLWLYGIYANLSLLWSIITSLYYVKCVRFFGPAIKNTKKNEIGYFNSTERRICKSKDSRD